MENYSNQDFTSIPIINLSLSETNKPLFLKKLKNAIINVGFFYIEDHNIPEELLKKIKDYTILFFNLPFEEKNKININLSPSFLGYLNSGTEKSSQKINNREQYIFINEINKKWEEGMPEYYKVYDSNVWPNESILPGFKELFLEYINIICNLSKDLLCFISESLGLPKYTLHNYVNEDSYCRGKILKYPNTNNKFENNQGVGPHKDATSLLTFLLPLDYLSGLQVQNHSGKWINVPKIDNTLIINLGLTLEHILNEVVSATTHRVINPPYGMGAR
jgi:isopenicillin N synthase-like dioxygenase